MTTLAPLAAKRTAISDPEPPREPAEPAPVTIAVLPINRLSRRTSGNGSSCASFNLAIQFRILRGAEGATALRVANGSSHLFVGRIWLDRNFPAMGPVAIGGPLQR